MRRLVAMLVLVLLHVDVRAADPAPNVEAAIGRGLNFLTKDSLVWKESKKCYECHHAPFTIWALNEGKKRGYTVDEKALAEMTSWALRKDFLAPLAVKKPAGEEIVFNEAPLLLALAVEAGDIKPMQDSLKTLLGSVVHDQGKDGSWKRTKESRPILSSPDTLTMLALLALTHPNAPDMGKEGKAAQERALLWLQSAQPDDELQPVVLRLLLWHRLGRPESELRPLAQQIRGLQNEDGGWGQIKKARSDAYATGQALYSLAQTGAKPDDEALRRGQSFLTKTQGKDGAWPITSRAIMANGKVATKFEPIIHASAAWAVMGLVCSARADSKPPAQPAR